MTPEAIKAALLLGAKIPKGRYDLGDGSTLHVVSDGSRFWYRSGDLHRLHPKNSPALEWASGSREWYCNGLRHRENGPATEWREGGGEYWKNGKRIR